jgi:hypothetical protein
VPRTDANLHHIGVFGRRTCGKTTLVIELCRAYYARERRFSVVLDPKAHEHNWGPHAHVISDRDRWLSAWQNPQCRNCNLVWEETSTTLKRAKDQEDVFTQKAGAHGHRLIVTGHGYSSMTPIMRDQVTELYLFRQSEAEAKEWSQMFADSRIMDACALDFERREFLHVRMGRAPTRHVLKLSPL